MMDGRLFVVVGSSRSGKTRWTRKQLEKAPLVVVWDVKGEYSLHWKTRKPLRGWVTTRTKKELIAAAKQAAAGKNIKICHVSDDMSEFDYFCRAAYTLGRVRSCVIVAEELADVTTPAKAPQGWGMICRKILGYGCDVYAITQRPAESDKTSIGNNSVIHCHRLARAKDRKYMAEEMDLGLDDFIKLKAGDWVEKYSCGKVIRGKN